MALTKVRGSGLGTVSTADLDGAVTINDSSADVDFRVESNGNANMLVVNAGDDKVGIGTSSPSTELHVSTSTQGDIVTFESTDAGANTGPNLLLYRNSSSPADDDNIGAIRFRGRNDNSQDVDYAEIETLIADVSDGTEDAVLAFRTIGSGTSSERFRINNSDHVLFYTTSVNAPNGNGGVIVADDANGSFVQISKKNTAAVPAMEFYNPNGRVGQIIPSGSNTSFTTSSDYRLKENVVTDWDATSRLKQLKPSRFNFKADKDTTVDGFLAHEVSSIVPEAITGEKDAVDKDGKPEYQGIDQSKLVPLLVKTIQELEARIATLESK